MRMHSVDYLIIAAGFRVVAVVKVFIGWGGNFDCCNVILNLVQISSNDLHTTLALTIRIRTISPF